MPCSWLALLVHSNNIVSRVTLLDKKTSRLTQTAIIAVKQSYYIYFILLIFIELDELWFFRGTYNFGILCPHGVVLPETIHWLKRVDRAFLSNIPLQYCSYIRSWFIGDFSEMQHYETA